jgi:predicted transposase YbfD/YdcC
MEYSTPKGKRGMSAGGVDYDLKSIYAQLGKLTDTRKARGKRYSLVTIMVIVIMAKICGQNTIVEIADWAKNNLDELVELMGLSRRTMPHHNTYRRILSNGVYVEEIERLVGEYNQQGEHGQVYAVDGKAVRGMKEKEESDHEYLLSVYDVEKGKTLAQVTVGCKENEMTQAKPVLNKVEIAEKVITADALHTHRGLSSYILEQKGHYLFPVKENQPNLYRDIQFLFTPEDDPKPGFGKVSTDFISAKKVNKGHGRIEIRTITTSEMMNAYSSWPGLAQVYRLEREFQWWRKGRKIRTSNEVEYGITSLKRKDVSVRALLSLRRDHWGIETGLHYRRDVTFKEDSLRMTVGNTGKIVACVHNLVIALIKQAGHNNVAKARRYYAGHLPEAFALLVAAPS